VANFFVWMLLEQIGRSVLIGLVMVVLLFDSLGVQSPGEWAVFLLGCFAAGSILNMIADMAMELRYGAKKEANNGN
jgi:hypothetical protein